VDAPAADQAALRLYDGYQHTAPALKPLVRRLQQALRQHGYQVTLDGEFGRSTAEAVRQFQYARRLTSSGMVDTATWRELTGRDRPRHICETTYADDDAGLRRDLIAVERYRPIIEQVASEIAMEPFLVVAIGSRESGWGRHLKPAGPRGKCRDTGGHGRGLLQIDDRYHEFARSGRWDDPEENIRYGVALLTQFLADVGRKARVEHGIPQIRVALAAYNCGAENVQLALDRGLDIDYFTAGRNYSADVLSRAGWFERRTNARLRAGAGGWN
jgi:hypothetical protein